MDKVTYCVIVMGIPCLVAFAGKPAAPRYLSPQAVVPSPSGVMLYIAEGTGNQVACLDLGSGAVSRTIALPAEPSGLAISEDGNRLYVTCGGPAGLVAVLDAAKGKVAQTIPVGHTPMSPVLSPDAKTLYVCNRFDNNVSVLDLAAGKETARIPAVREPVAAALAPDGKLLVVANLLPAGPSDGQCVAAAVSLIDTTSGKTTTVPLPDGSTGLRGVCVLPEGRYACVTHVLGRYHLPTTQLERGWMNTNALSVIDLAAGKLLNTVLLDDLDRGAANPWAIACTADGKNLCVTHAGTHELSVIDLPGLLEKLAKAAGRKDIKADDVAVPDDLTFLVGLRRRIALKGNGPRCLTLIGTKAYVGEYFSDSLSVADLAPLERPDVKAIVLSPTPPTPVRRGEMLFHDASPCFQNWQSCSSCHPDARADGLNWDLLNDGIGNPKNTRSLLLAHQTPPVMSLGVRDTAEVAVRAGIRSIQFSIRPEQDAADIDQYLKSLKPAPSPHLVNGKLSDSARRGQKVFEQAGCASCHPPGLYTDLQQYNLGLGKGLDADKKFDTPTLVEVWRTAPYLYDGRAATMEEVFTKCNIED